MKQDMVVANLRIPKNDWLQIKIIAAERGMSANEYVNHVLITATTQEMFPKNKMSNKKVKKDEHLGFAKTCPPFQTN